MKAKSFEILFDISVSEMVAKILSPSREIEREMFVGDACVLTYLACTLRREGTASLKRRCLTRVSI